MEAERPEQIESVDERQFVEFRDQVFEHHKQSISDIVKRKQKELDEAIEILKDFSSKIPIDAFSNVYLPGFNESLIKVRSFLNKHE